MLIRIPKTFYDDHSIQRELPAPPILRNLAKHYIIDAAHEDATELLDDAEFYCDPAGPIASENYQREYLGLRSSARATMNALIKAGVHA